MPGPLVFIDRCHSGQLRKTWSSATPQVTESTKRILLDERGARIFGILASLHPCTARPSQESCKMHKVHKMHRRGPEVQTRFRGGAEC